MLSDDELLRYSRQIMLPNWDVPAQQRLRDSTALIVGAGGLGCPVALYLAAAGIGRLVLVDFDQVDLSNLQRQILHHTSDIGRAKVQSAAEKVRALNPHVNVEAVTALIDDGLLAHWLPQVDVVLDCCDNFPTRYLVNAACMQAGVPLVSGAAIGWSGQLAVFDPRADNSPCYRCLYPDGEEAAATCAESGVLSALTGVVGTLQALEALKLLTGTGQVLVGELLLIEAADLSFRRLRLRRDDACPVCQGRKGELK